MSTAGEPYEVMGELARILSLRAGYNTNVVLLGTMCLGIAAGVVGTFALLRRRALMGDALAHATLPGVALAFILSASLTGGHKSMPLLLVGAGVTGVLGVLGVHAIRRFSRLTEDVAIGVILSVFFGIGIVLQSYIQTMPGASPGGLNQFIYGQPAAMRAGEAALIAGVALFVILAVGVLFKELRLVCFDDRFGAATGLPVSLLDLSLMTLVVIVTVIGLQAVGILLVVAVLIIPPAAARFWTHRAGPMVVVAGLIGGVCGLLGASASALAEDLPAGAVIVLIAGGVFAVSALVAPSRGVIARGVARTSWRLRIARERALRGLYEIIESRGSSVRAGVAVQRAQLAAYRSWTPSLLRFVLVTLRLTGHVRPALATPGSVSLTRPGALDAARITRRHRLWEAYLVSVVDRSESHVDRPADFVEHVLDRELVETLEKTLGEVAPPKGVGGSVHPIASPSPASPGGGGQ